MKLDEEDNVMSYGCVYLHRSYVGDITIGYDPSRRGRVIPLVVHNEKAQEDAEDGGS